MTIRGNHPLLTDYQLGFWHALLTIWFMDHTKMSVEYRRGFYDAEQLTMKIGIPDNDQWLDYCREYNRLTEAFGQVATDQERADAIERIKALGC